MSDKEEILNTLEAEARTADASLEELTIAPESELEEVDELREKNEELQQKIDELQQAQEQVQKVAEIYAESLADAYPVFEADELIDKHDVEELREKYEEAVEEGQVDNLTSGTPDPRSGDTNAGSHDPNAQEDTQPDTPDAEVEEAAEVLEKRGGVWGELADEMKEDGI